MSSLFSPVSWDEQAVHFFDEPKRLQARCIGLAHIAMIGRTGTIRCRVVCSLGLRWARKLAIGPSIEKA
jgi:hypothetical protein